MCENNNELLTSQIFFYFYPKQHVSVTVDMNTISTSLIRRVFTRACSPTHVLSRGMKSR
jgi:hypothetical protein